MSLRRVLIVQPYGIGDLLFVTPVLRALRLVPSVETVDILLGSRTESVISSNPHVDEITVIDKDLFHQRTAQANFKEMAALGKRLRKKKYDLLIDFSLRSEYGFFSAFFMGIPKRAGFDYKRRGFFHNLRLPLPNGFSNRHVVDYFCDLAETAGVKVQDRFLEFYLSEEERKDASYYLNIHKIKKPLVFSLVGGESWGKDAYFKRWPVRYFAEWVRALRDRLDFDGVVLVGSSGEKILGREFENSAKVRCANLAGEISLAASAALIEKAVLFAGNDGGLVHLAHALGVPVVAFYGPVDPAVYGPFPASEEAIAVFKEELACRPCYQKFRYRSECVGRECLQALTPVEVLAFLDRRKFFDTSRFYSHAG